MHLATAVRDLDMNAPPNAGYCAPVVGLDLNQI